MEVKVVIPTKGRAKTIISHNHVANCIICCPDAEAAAYKESCPDNEIVSHPDDMLGLALKRQWIMDKFGDVFMIDDDISGMTNLAKKAGEVRKVPPDKAYWIIQNCANVAKIAGCYLFGFNNFVRPEHYHGHEPYALTGYINECAIGLLSGTPHLKFNPDIKGSGDYYICALNAYFHRKSFIDKRYCFIQDGIGNQTGGASEYRTGETEKKDFELLRFFFGDAIQPKTGGRFANRHAHSKRLRIPF